MADSRNMTRSSDPRSLPRDPVAEIQGSLASRVGSSLQQQGPMNAGTPLHNLTHPEAFTDPLWPTVPEQIGVDRMAWAGFSPAVRKAIIAGKLPDLSPKGHEAILVQFDLCAPPRFAPPMGQNPGAPGPPPPMGQNPGVPGQPPPVGQNPGIPGGPPPMGQNPGVQSPPPPTTQTAQVQGQPVPTAQVAQAMPAGGVWGYPPPPQMFMMPAPAGQVQQSGPQYPPTMGWVVLGGALLVTAWMLYEVTRMKSELQHGRR